jgi:hypothetical protein
MDIPARGDGNAYVGGQLNLGRITPRLPMSTAPGGWGNSVNIGCGDGGGICVSSRQLVDPEIPIPNPDPWFGIIDPRCPIPNDPPRIEPIDPDNPPIELEPLPWKLGHQDLVDPLSPPVASITVYAAVKPDPCKCCYDNLKPNMKCDDTHPFDGNWFCKGSGASFRWPNAQSWCCMWKKGDKAACDRAARNCIEGCLKSILASIIPLRIVSEALSIWLSIESMINFNWESLIGDIIGWILAYGLSPVAGLGYALYRFLVCGSCCIAARYSCVNLAGRSFCPKIYGGGIYDFKEACA